MCARAHREEEKKSSVISTLVPVGSTAQLTTQPIPYTLYSHTQLLICVY